MRLSVRAGAQGRRWRTLGPGVAGLLLAIMALAPGRAAEAELARLKPLVASPFLLLPPGELKGQFTIAKRAPKLKLAVLPVPHSASQPGRLWSVWGDAHWASDGQVYFTVGDQGAPQGQAWLLRLEPASGAITKVLSVAELLDLPAGAWVPGRVLATPVEPGDGWLYLATYRGSDTPVAGAASYPGDYLLRWHLTEGRAESLELVLPGAGIHSLAAAPGSQRLYGLAQPLRPEDGAARFFIYDPATRAMVLEDAPPPGPARAFWLNGAGRAWYEAQGQILRYAPAENTVVKLALRLSVAGGLRAVTPVGDDHRGWGVTQAGALLEINTWKDTITVLPQPFEALWPSAVLRQTPAGTHLVLAPGGSQSSRLGSPLLAYDLRAGQYQVLAFLAMTVAAQAQVHLGACQGLVMDATGKRLVTIWNAGLAKSATPEHGQIVVIEAEWQ